MKNERGPLSVADLRRSVDAGEIDTVVLAFTDMQGRLQGKRFHAPYFVEVVLPGTAEACNYLLAVDMEMRPVPGYEMASWERGYGDFVMRPDLSTLRITPWNPGTAIVLSDLEWHDGRPVVASPRQVLRSQTARLEARGWSAVAGTELEFVLFRDSYEDAWHNRYQGLTPANLYNVDYSVLGTSRVEPLLRRIRKEMAGAGLEPESAKGECNPGQHEIAFRYAEVTETADRHVLYKTGAKEIAAQEGASITFMAKIDEREGNSCHVHLSLRDSANRPLFAGPSEDASTSAGTGPVPSSPVFANFTAGVLATMREMTLMFAPNINSYKRYCEGSFAPTKVLWGVDNRTCALRAVGEGESLRIENRIPGGDVNPYLALAAMIAGGLYGVEQELPLSPAFAGNAYHCDGAESLPRSLREAAELFEKSSVASDAFGEEVVRHYTNMARREAEEFESSVTDWELIRGFERS